MLRAGSLERLEVWDCLGILAVQNRSEIGVIAVVSSFGTSCLETFLAATLPLTGRGITIVVVVVVVVVIVVVAVVGTLGSWQLAPKS